MIELLPNHARHESYVAADACVTWMHAAEDASFKADCGVDSGMIVVFRVRIEGGFEMVEEVENRSGGGRRARKEAFGETAVALALDEDVEAADPARDEKDGSPMIMSSALIKPRSQSAFAPYSLPASPLAIKTRASRPLSAV